MMTSILRSCRCGLFAGFLMFAHSVLGADDMPFAGGLSTAEKTAIGLDQMSPEQIAALEAAVQRYVRGRESEAVAQATEAARSEVEETLVEREAQLEQARVELAETKAQLEEKEKKSEDGKGLLERARVLLSPGTKIEFTTLSARLVEPFQGWKAGTEFKLDNGQIWRVTKGKYWSPREDAGKAVTIEPGVLGSFFIRIEGVKQTPRVELVSRN
jgi:hypothetical protein